MDAGQDCPNYYISYPPDFSSAFVGMSPLTLIASGTAASVALAPAKPAGAAAVFIISYFVSGILFYEYPAQVSATIVKSDIFPKKVNYQEVNGVKYNDNDGYYYMELPASVQFSKVYFADEPDPEKRSRVVITKG